ncbi:MAG: M20/M25/M40 family metallo-hydrolase [Acutalibacteraceae bacterium]
MKYLLIIPAAMVAVLLIAVIRAAMLRPTPAKTASLPKADEKRSEDYARKLSEMIKVDTVSDRDNFDPEKFQRYHERLAELFPLVFSKLEVHDLDGNLIIKWKGKTDADAVLFLSHQDVVPAEGEWDHDPFGGEISGGVIHGRGAMDTKASGFCIFQAAEELLAQGYQPEVDIYLGGSCTEEISGDGAKKTVRWLKDNGVKLAMVLDEGGTVLENPIGGVKGLYAMVGVLEKGYGDVKFTARGKGGHASSPPKGTPWARMGEFIADVEKHDPFTPKLNGTITEMFRRLAPNMNFGMRLVFANLWLFKPLVTRLLGKISPQGGAMIKTTLAFTKGKGSNGYNVLPTEVYVTGNMRFINHQPTDESIRIISEKAKKYDIETQVLKAKVPSEPISFTGSAFKLIEQAVGKIYPGIDTVPYVMTGGTDAKDYEEICPDCIRFAPLYLSASQLASMHAENENINVSALAPAVDFFKYLMENGENA